MESRSKLQSTKATELNHPMCECCQGPEHQERRIPRRDFLTAGAGVVLGASAIGSVLPAGRVWAQAKATEATAAAAAVAADTRAQTPEQVNVEAFISGVRAARVFDLGFTWDQSAPLLSLNPPYAFALNATHRQTHEVFGTAPGSQVSWASEILYMSGQHGAPTIDAIGHIGRNLKPARALGMRTIKVDGEEQALAELAGVLGFALG